MIKYIQKLKAKKGFTLVELIVVIAIIGVLAAILIPVMLGYVTDSRVTSADSTASTLRQALNTYIGDMATKKASVLQINNAQTVTITSTASGGDSDASGSTYETVTVSVPDAMLSTSAQSYTTKVKKPDDTEVEVDWAGNFAKKVFDEYGKNKFTAKLYVKNGLCIGCAYYEGDSLAEGDWPTDQSFTNGSFGWGQKDGVTESGEIIGTNPKLIKS